jgi:hypothetical protein
LEFPIASFHAAILSKGIPDANHRESMSLRLDKQNVSGRITALSEKWQNAVPELGGATGTELRLHVDGTSPSITSPSITSPSITSPSIATSA